MDRLLGIDDLHAEGRGEVPLAGSGRSEQVDCIATVNEAELGQGKDAATVEGWMEGEVEAGQSLSRWSSAQAGRARSPGTA